MSDDTIEERSVRKAEVTKVEESLVASEKYTQIFHEKNFQFNAPHHFKILSSTEKATLAEINFQCGPIAEQGVNGVTNENLLNIVKIRLEGFQNSDFKCRENAIALTHIEEALLWLAYRTSKREARGVEGTHKV
jgi:hypothetical protein